MNTEIHRLAMIIAVSFFLFRVKMPYGYSRSRSFIPLQ